jgi:hypothetical protein
MRNCTRDEGGPFEFGNQVLIPSHRNLLRSKAVAMLLSIDAPGASGHCQRPQLSCLDVLD